MGGRRRGLKFTDSTRLDGSATVVLLVYDPSGNAAWSGATPTLTKETSYWQGTIDVTATGVDVFCAYALGVDGLPLYVGKATQNITGPASITIGVGAAGLEGGSIQGKPLSLTTAVNTINNSGTIAPGNLTTDGTNLYIADNGYHCIRKIMIATGALTIFAGSEDGVYGYADGTGNLSGAGTARFNLPYGITTDGTNLYIADEGNQCIRAVVISTGEVTTVAGSTTKGTESSADDGVGTAARFCIPLGITTDGTNLFVGDNDSGFIRKIQ